jgi:hypothetical protein
MRRFSILFPLFFAAILFLAGCPKPKTNDDIGRIEYKLTASSMSPDHRWTAEILTEERFDEANTIPGSTKDDIRVKRGEMYYGLDWPERDDASRLKWLSKPVFSADSQQMAVFQRDELGTGNILIWHLPDGKLSIVKSDRGDLERIGFDRKGHIYISTVRHKYNTD